MTSDFNIRDSDWDPNFYYYSIHTKDLLTITDSLGLELSLPLDPRLTRYTNNPHNANFVLNLVFFFFFGRVKTSIPAQRKYMQMLYSVGLDVMNCLTKTFFFFFFFSSYLFLYK